MAIPPATCPSYMTRWKRIHISQSLPFLYREYPPSWELTYPLPNELLKRIFLFHGWDMLVPWRVDLFIQLQLPLFLSPRNLPVATSTRVIFVQVSVSLVGRLDTSIRLFTFIFYRKPGNIHHIHPRKQTWDLKNKPWKRRNIYKPPIIGFHASFQGLYHLKYPKSPNKNPPLRPRKST